ncbi:MAG: bifunctional ornithine acetyltransferase/N-acetylglutamate synthase [Spirochaetes bacterium]|nr:bifunctional ornithine acetyltransferase/N-acetylglutamate synthase [Spirochaetota bacterium]
MESYSSEKEYLEDLASRAALPKGFRCSVAGIRFLPRERTVAEPLPMNLALIALDEETPSFAGVFTRNRFPGAPVLIGRERLARPTIRGVLANNKISNVCAPQGGQDAARLLASLGTQLGVPGDAFFTASTGIIGWSLPVADMEAALPRLSAGLDPSSILPVARAIMTTDSFPKVRRARVGKGSIVGVAKGAGMIEPNMATLLCFLCTDVEVGRERLRESLAWCVERSLNRISIDSDQSTSDTALLFSSGKSGKADPDEFRAGLLAVLSALAADIVRNGEGVGHVMRVRVERGRDEAAAIGVAKAIVNSPLVKTAVHGNDPNVGRIVSAIGDYMGNAGLPLETRSVLVRLGGMEIFSGGCFRLDAQKEESLSSYLRQCALEPGRMGYPQHDRSVEIEVILDGTAPPVDVLGSDLSCEYVRENADYRS